MFIPNEIITEILNHLDYQTWKDQIKKINQQYHSYYEYCDNIGYSHRYRECLHCKIHGRFVANWRNNGYYNGHYSPINTRLVKNKIYPICVDSKIHEPKFITISHIKLPHNY